MAKPEEMNSEKTNLTFNIIAWLVTELCAGKRRRSMKGEKPMLEKGSTCNFERNCTCPASPARATPPL